MSPEQVAGLEELIGDFLSELGYSLGSEAKLGAGLRAQRLRATYLRMFGAKRWMKSTPLGRFVDLRNIEVESDNPPNVE